MKFLLLSGLALLAVDTSAIAENWNSISHSANNVFMADVDNISTNGDATRVIVATVPRRGEATDYSHSLETYEFKCEAGQWRTAGIVEHGENGTELGRILEEGSDWEPVRADTLPDYLRRVVCDGARADPPTWPSIKAFVDGGRIVPPVDGPSPN